MNLTDTRKTTMMMNTTLAQLRDLKLLGMLAAVDEQMTQAALHGMSFEERQIGRASCRERVCAVV